MLPSLKQAVKRYQVGSVDRLLELTREAEELILAKRNYKPPPKPEECLMPELVYKGAEPAKTAKNNKPGVAAIADATPDLMKLLEQFWAQKLKEQGDKAAQSKPKTAQPKKIEKVEGTLASAKVADDKPANKKKSGKSTSQRPSKWSTATVANHQIDIGRTVRMWKLKFDGSKDSSIEEFIQRVGECRTLAYMSDEDLLNAMTELMSGVALYWCRQSRANWRTWADFFAAARRCYGVDPKFQQRLVVEAQTRTQGIDEPVRDYAV